LHTRASDEPGFAGCVVLFGQFRYRAAAGLLDAGNLEVGPAGIGESELTRIGHAEADFAEVVGCVFEDDGWGICSEQLTILGSGRLDGGCCGCQGRLPGEEGKQ